MTTGTAAIEAIKSLELLESICVRTFAPSEGEKVVFGEGPEKAELMLIGEAPGKEEAKIGRPFVGNSGRLLNKYLQQAGIDREKAYITNVMKIRPPENRTPRKSEIDEALPFLNRQIELVNPGIIVLLGSIALKAVIDPKAKITQMRGDWQEKSDMIIMPTYHPSAIFHDEAKKELFKKDLDQAGKRLRNGLTLKHN